METSNRIKGGNGHSTATLPAPAPPTEHGDASTEETSRLTRRVAADVVTVDRGAVGVVRAERAEVRTALAGVVFSSKQAAIDRSFVRELVATGPVELSKAGAGTVIAAGDVTVARAGAGALLALGHLDIQQGGACGLLAGSATVARGGIVGVAITPKLAVSDGGRVFVGPAGALSIMAGAAAGLGIGWLLGRARG